MTHIGINLHASVEYTSLMKENGNLIKMKYRIEENYLFAWDSH